MGKRNKDARRSERLQPTSRSYGGLLTGISDLLDQARRTAARTVNTILAATYWEIGWRIVEFEQDGMERAEYGASLLQRLSFDLNQRFGRGFSRSNLQQMRLFYLGWQICQTPSGKSEGRVRVRRGVPSVSEMGLEGGSENCAIAPGMRADGSGVLTIMFPLPWSHYVRLMSVEEEQARVFYESEAIRGGWSVRQLDRQISTQFFERTARSKQQAVMLARGQKPRPEDAVVAEDEVRDPYLLEFLDLKDEYGESDLEDALIAHLETFLLELGSGFTFVARQKRIRVGNAWYRIDLLLFHRRLKCLVVIDLKIGAFTHSDAGQMGLYLTYAKEHMMEPGENEPIGIILCSDKDDAVVRYSMGHMPAKVFASRYLTVLPDAETLRREILKTQQSLITREASKPRLSRP